MSYRSLQDCPPGMRRLIQAQMAAAPAGEVRPVKGNEAAALAPSAARKYRNVPCESGGLKFDSKLERNCYFALVERYGEANVWPHHSTFILPGGVKMRPDFTVRVPQHGGQFDKYSDAWIKLRVFDAKGAEPTQDWKNKRKGVLAIFGVQVEILKSPKDVWRDGE